MAEGDAELTIRIPFNASVTEAFGIASGRPVNQDDFVGRMSVAPQAGVPLPIWNTAPNTSSARWNDLGESSGLHVV